MKPDPRIILFDLEIIPDLKEALRVWPQLSQYPGKTLRATITSICCAGWKVFGEKKTHCINAWDFKEWKKDINNDYQVVKAISEILETSDAVVSHNGIRFDFKYLQTRLMKHKLPPLPSIHHIDTCSLAKRNLYAFNNKLDTIGELVANERKLAHQGWDLWVETHGGEAKAMAKMEKYCKQDVNLLEKVFKPLRPFAKNIPNYSLSSVGEKPICPSCGSTRLKDKGYRYTKTSTYKRYVCRDCNSYSRTNMRDKVPRSI